MREDKSTTKFRIVYTASARENGPASNDCLHTGPPLTPDILDILVRFRDQPIAVVADIEKAFLMIAVKKEDKDVLRFLWVDTVNSVEPKIVEYGFARVVFGVTSSPFLLNAILLKHITSYEREDPEFANQMLRSLYVDDLSLSLEDEAYELYLKSRERMAQGGFNLRKWLTNSRPLMEKIKEMESQRESSIQRERDLIDQCAGDSRKLFKLVTFLCKDPSDSDSDDPVVLSNKFGEFFVKKLNLSRIPSVIFKLILHGLILLLPL